MATQDRRPRFYEGQFLAADDLAAIVEYFRAGDARHALAGHTWGIALGLHLLEKNAPGAPNRKEVLLQPGFAWDGFGRPIVVTQPERLPESLFEGIAYNAAIDDPALPGGPPGRLVKVWLNYRETQAQRPAPGFETCAADGQNARVREGFELVAGEFPAGPQQRADVTIGPVSVEATRAVREFDPAAPLLWDASVPHQTFPTARPPRWLLPVGYVRWVAGDGLPGYFLDRLHVTSDNVPDRIRGFRRYVGVVAEEVQAAAGVIVLRRRGDQPDAAHRFRRLLSSQSAASLLTDLVWVEGNLRVEGDAKLARGKLVFRDADGLHQGTPLYLARHGDDPVGGAAGARELRVAIGGDAQRDNRLLVGPEKIAGTTVDVLPNLAVVSGRPAPLVGGVVGVNVGAPERSLHVRGDRIRIESNDQAKRLDLRVDASAVDLHSETNKLYIHASGPAAGGHNHVVINAQKGTGDGNVGIGTATPVHGLDVKARSINLGLDEDGGGRMVLRHDAGHQVLVEGTNSAGAASTPELRFSGPAGANLPLLAGYADTTYLKGKLGVTVAAPAADTQVHVRGTRIRLESNDSLRVVDLRADGSHVDLQTSTSHLYLRSTVTGGPASNHIVMNPGAADGLVGIGTAGPQAKLHVVGDAVVSGNVGIGTTAPQQKLHVAGAFLLVDGAGGEQAYIGGDASAGGDVQIGSSNVAIERVHFWNTAYGSWMDLRTRDVRCRELFWEDETFVSDVRRKTDIQPVTGVLDRVCRLRGVSFEWRSPAATTRAPGRPAAGPTARSRARRLGLIAQEVGEVFPEIVRKVDDDETGISMTALFPLLIESIKELKAEVDNLREQVKALSTTRAEPTKRG